MTDPGVPRAPRWFIGAALTAAALLSFLAPARAAERLADPAWNPGAQWLSIRFGYAKEQGQFSPNGNVGWGFGYSRMLSKRLSLGANVQQDLLGKYDGAALIAIPLTAEVLWHFKWNTALRPYVGADMQTVYRKMYRTGADESQIQPGYGFSVGANTGIDRSHLLGVDLRFSTVANDHWSFNPVFGTRRPSNILVSAKLTYALTY